MSREAKQRALAKAKELEESGAVAGFKTVDRGNAMRGYREVRRVEGMFDGSRDAAGEAGERDKEGRVL